MTASLVFTLTFAAALLASIGVRLWLATRQIRHVARHRAAVPPAFAERISLASHQRAADYTRARVQLGLVDMGVGVVMLLGFTLFGGLAWLHGAWLALLPESPLLQQILLVLTVVILSSLIELPVAVYRQFRLEKAFGFNRMTPGLFVSDFLKSGLVMALLGVPLLAAVIALMEGAGPWWWLWAWGVWVVFNGAILVLYPTVIAPLFNRFSPLEAGPVRERVEALLARCGFSSRGVFVMDGSRRSAHGNAYFTGLGKSKRIVFFDTLLSRLDPDEIEAVLAHELGHFHHRHIVKRMAVSFGLSLAALALLGWLAQSPWFYQGLGVTPDPNGPTSALALVLFLLVAPVFTFLAQPLASLASRRHEYEADAFAARQSGAQRLIQALVKLYEDNAATLTPDPIHSAFYDSHPPAALRIARLGTQQA